MPVEHNNPKAIGQIFVQILLIFPYKSVNLMVAPRICEMINPTTWQLDFFTSFDHYSKGLRVELALAFLSDF